MDLEEDTAIFFISDNGSPAGAPMCHGYTDQNNLPLRAGKGTLYEGGIRVTYIVQWKAGRLPAGTTYDRPVSTLDVVPSALAMSGIASPANLPGVNILPYLKGKKPDEETIKKAQQEGVPLLVTEHQTFEIAGKLHQMGISGMR